MFLKKNIEYFYISFQLFKNRKALLHHHQNVVLVSAAEERERTSKKRQMGNLCNRNILNQITDKKMLC